MGPTYLCWGSHSKNCRSRARLKLHIHYVETKTMCHNGIERIKLHIPYEQDHVSPEVMFRQTSAIPSLELGWKNSSRGKNDRSLQSEFQLATIEIQLKLLFEGAYCVVLVARVVFLVLVVHVVFVVLVVLVVCAVLVDQDKEKGKQKEKDKGKQK